MTPPTWLLAFDALASAQRGAPEEAMLRWQHAQASQLLHTVAEHVGDLTHRMAERPWWFETAGYETVKAKVEMALRRLHSRYGFEREVAEQYRNNAQYHTENNPARPVTAEQLQQLARHHGHLYAEAHRKLPVYNAMQWLAREAAISLGEHNFDRTRWALRALQVVLNQGPEIWAQRAHAHPTFPDQPTVPLRGYPFGLAPSRTAPPPKACFTVA